MTGDTLALRTLLEKGPDADFLRYMIGFAADRLMDREVAGLTGAAHFERTGQWAVQRSRYMTVETIAPMGDDARVSLPTLPAGSPAQRSGEARDERRLERHSA